ncbi:MAG: NusG domain II-containing protein [Lachnospiraceae bacterium]|nr:NusG domain II-containing protein [Lachnospiraceae bacterium]
MKKEERFALILGILLSIILITSLIIIFKDNFNDKSLSRTACIYSDGKLVKEIPLNSQTPDMTFTIESKYGSNTITVKEGAIAVTDADCANKICVKEGFISNSRLPITCLPNRLIITIKTKDDSALDAVTY